MDVEEIQAIFKFSAWERDIISSFEIQAELFLPFLLSLKSGGSCIAVKDVITYYNDESKTGYTLEKIYLFIEPEIVEKEGVIYRLEKCGSREERELVERPYCISLRAKKVIFAEVNPSLRTIRIKEMKKGTYA